MLHPRATTGRRLTTAAAVLLSCAALGACDAGTGGWQAGVRGSAVGPSVAPLAADPTGAPTAPAAPTEDAVAELAGFDWQTPAYDAAGCSSREDWLAYGGRLEDWQTTVEPVSTDLTGDRSPEALVTLTCPAMTSSRSTVVVVFDIAGPAPRVLEVLGDDQGFRGLELTTGPRTVTLSGASVSGEDPYCCPGHVGSVTYRWTGGSFVVTEEWRALTTQPLVAGGLDDGEHVVVVRAVAEDRVMVDLVEWFEGPAAVVACAQDGMVVLDGAFCSEYYVRNADDLVRELPVAEGARIEVPDTDTGRVHTVDDVRALAGTPMVSDLPQDGELMRVTVQDGAVTAMEHVFLS